MINGIIKSRELDILIAKFAGWTQHHAALYSPDGTLHGGDYLLHSRHQDATGEKEQEIWNDYAPHYTTDLNWAFSLPVEGNYFLDLHSPTKDDDQWNAFVTDRWESDEDGHPTVEYSASAKTGALALCLAWMKYMGIRPQMDPKSVEFSESRY